MLPVKGSPCLLSTDTHVNARIPLWHAPAPRCSRGSVPLLSNTPRLPAVGPSQPARIGRSLCVTRAVLTPPVSSPSVADKLSSGSAAVAQVYRYPGMSDPALQTLLHKAQAKVSDAITAIDCELCYNVSVTAPLSSKEAETLTWLLRETFEPQGLTPESRFKAGDHTVVEVGPRMSFSTAFSTNAVSIAASCGLGKVNRLELSKRFALNASRPLSGPEQQAFAALVHDRMTEEVYSRPVASFAVNTPPAPVFSVPLMKRGRPALEEINKEMGLAFDEWDLDYYTQLFRDDMKRDPTNVELFDIAQSNSEHSRHWFFRGNLVIDGQAMPHNLFQVVKEPWLRNPNNSVVAFKDNSSAIRGFQVQPMLPVSPGNPSPLAPQPRDWDLLLTAETHNFPCAVAPYPGAETGAGGRMRDTHATGTGSIMGAGTAGYCVGNLRMDGNLQPWDDMSFKYPESLASPLQILIDASNGASDYGNKFGEPLVSGYCRTFGQRLPNGERREWIKPIMFSGGVGQIDHRHLEKSAPEISMLVVKIGGPAYRIGMGGGAASSIPSGGNRADLDFNAVQRGDAEMSQKLWRVVRSCVEMGDKNPIVQIHDQGAGGNCNVVKEIIYPLGAEIDVRAVRVGDETLSVLEIWGAEYQENDALLIRPEQRAALQAICDRERCLMQVIGSIDGSGRVKLVDRNAPPGTPPAVDLDLEKVLGKMPDKTFEFTRSPPVLHPLALPEGTGAEAALQRVLRLPSVCSKRFLTTKVDRHVTGLVAQQQCVGPLQLPLSNVAVYAQSHQDFTGLATAIGEQPIKGLINPAAMARLALGEALTNLVWARATALPDVRASVNWMYAAKMGNEGPAMYDAATSLSAAMIELGVACDGGKDSLSMAALAEGETVMSPGNLVVSAYVGCPDITQVVTPDLKLGDEGVLLHVDLGRGRRRLGGSALAQAYSQLGDCCPDVAAADLRAMWEVTQQLIGGAKISAGHDISDGGIATTLCEMAFAGNCGVQVDLAAPSLSADVGCGSALAALFAEELGLVVEVAAGEAEQVQAAYAGAGLAAARIGKVTAAKQVRLAVAGSAAIEGATEELREAWEETAFALERLQANEETVAAEQAVQRTRTAPRWHLPFTPSFTPEDKMKATDKVRVAIIREEGSNGDREMAAACHAAGLEPWDVTMSDLLNGRAALDSFRGVVFVGGFSYADTLDSAKGWAAAIRFNDRVIAQFQAFYARPDTWSLGVCNGCQLMALLGWVPAGGAASDKAGGILPDLAQPRFVHNKSGRFESRWINVHIADDSPSILLKGMGGATIGVWAAHGEGQALFPDQAVKEHVLANKLAPIRYTDPQGNATEAYPFNPNGSPLGIAALTSENGRHLAMMPHPERCFLAWQLPWAPKELGLQAKGPAPWIKLFQNAREWCEAQDAAKQ
ncbi:CobB/CobQ-like glutamine amidotransferase domain-containing protein [Haematococcus lacustris]